MIEMMYVGERGRSVNNEGWRDVEVSFPRWSSRRVTSGADSPNSRLKGSNHPQTLAALIWQVYDKALFYFRVKLLKSWTARHLESICAGCAN